MARMLFKGIDAYNSNPIKDAGCYKAGDCVEIMEDGHIWGNGQQPPAFVCVDVPFVKKAKLIKYLSVWMDDKNYEEMLPGFKVKSRMFRKRLWSFRWNDLPAGIKNKLRTTGLIIKASPLCKKYDVTWEQVKRFILNHQTLVNEAEDL